MSAAVDPFEPWELDALCAQVGSAPFFPDKGESTRDAKRVCGRCPVTDQCLARALSMPLNPFGIWGGTSERERREMRRKGVAA
ncbi:WhiB family transcription factor [Mycobacterium Phage Nergal]|nr:WhiB family transcription factor [Mycobacterium Phage Nergal]